MTNQDDIVYIPLPSERLTVRQQSDVSAIIHKHLRVAHRSNDPKAYIIAKQKGLTEILNYCYKYDLPDTGDHINKAIFTYDVYTEYTK